MRRRQGRAVGMGKWCNRTVRQFGTQLAWDTADGRNPSRGPVVIDQSLNFDACKLAAVLYGPEDDVDPLLFGSRLPI